MNTFNFKTFNFTINDNNMKIYQTVLGNLIMFDEEKDIQDLYKAIAYHKRFYFDANEMTLMNFDDSFKIQSFKIDDNLANELWISLDSEKDFLIPIQFDHLFSRINPQNIHDIRKALLMLSGDVETNPGPVQSRPVHYRNNDPRYAQLEKAVLRRDEKIRTLIKKLRQEIKSNKIYTQGFFGDISVNGKDLNNNISRICNFLENNLPSYVNVISNSTLAFSNNNSELVDKINTTGNGLLDRIDNIKNDIIKITILCLIVKLLLTWNYNKLALVIILSFVCKFYNLDSYILDLINQLKEKIARSENQNDIQVQGAKEVFEQIIYHDYFELVGKILFAALSFICIRKIPGRNDWDTFMTRLDKIPKAKKGAEEIIDYCSKYFDAANDTIKMMVLGKTREELKRANGLYDEIHDWAKEVRHYLDLEERNKIDLDVETATKVENLYKRGLKYQSDTLLDREMSRLVTTTLLPARELYQYVSSSPVKGGGPRMRPICLWLVGESGVGKTEVVYPLCIDVLRTMGMISPNDYHHQVYGRQVETEYWDGYKGQKIVIYDDAFQMKDDKTNPNQEIFEVIRSCNSFPQHLHMAALHDKNTFSAAELLLYTTNDFNVKLESITFPEAFYNRMAEHAYKVRPRLEYSIEAKKPNSTETYRKLDKSKLNPNVAIDLSVYEFQKLVKDNESQGHWIEQGEPILYDDFAKLICDEWKRGKEAFMKKIQFLNERASRPIQAQVNVENEIFQDALDDPNPERLEDIFRRSKPEMKVDNSFEDYDFASEIATRIHGGEDLLEIQADFAESKEKHAAYTRWLTLNRKETKWDKYRNRLDNVLLDVRDYINKLKNEITNIIRSHPYLTALSLVGIVVAGFGMYSTFKHFLGKKNETKEKKSFRITGRNVVEVGHSGDSKTIRNKITKVEVGTSGDNKTNKHSIKKIESNINDIDKLTKTLEIKQMYDLMMSISEDWEPKERDAYRQRMRDYFNSDKFESLAEVASSGDAKTHRQTQKRIESGDELDNELEHQVMVQGTSDAAAHNLVTDVLRKNTYRLSYFRGDKRYALGNCTFVRGWCFVIPYHFLHALYARQLTSDTILHFSQAGLEDIIQVPLSHIMTMGPNGIELTSSCVQMKAKDGSTRDCVMVNLHQQMSHPHRDLLRHFVRVSDQGKLVGSFSGVLATFHESGDELVRTYQWLQKIRPYDREVTIHYPDDGYDYGEQRYFTQRDCYEYNAPTQVGDCGSLIGIYCHRMERKVIGMHIAGSSDEHGYACPLTQESLQNAMDVLLERDARNVSAQFYYELDSNMDGSVEPEVPNGLFVPIGKAPTPVGQAVKTSIVPSALHGKISEPTTCPTLLRPAMINGTMINPLMNGLKKCGVSTAVLPVATVSSAAQDVCQVVLTNYKSTLEVQKYRRFLTYEQAIMGTGDDDFMRSINRTTSPGYPYCLEKKSGPGKTFWMGQGDEFDFASPPAKRLRQDVTNLIEDCAAGIIRGVVFVDTLKDERRELHKVAVGKTRVFSAGPQHFVVAFRQYFLPFAAYLMHNRIDNEVCVGTNPYSIDWERISRRLKVKGEHVIAGDFGNFDGSLVAQVLWSIFWEIFVPWMSTFVDMESDYGKRTLKICLGLWTHLVHSVHIFKNNVYMWTHSQPSGNPFTVIINCLYNSIIMRIAWIKIMEKKEPKYVSMKWFRHFVSMVSYGDDNVLNISEQVLHLYNQETISEIMREMKHEYTDEAKTGTIVKSRKLDEIFFLKRGFVFSEELQRTIAPLKKEVIYEMLNWSRNTIDPNVILMTNIDVAMREIVYHGRHEYQQLKQRIMDNVDCLPSYPQILTYEQYLHDIKYLADAVYDF